MQKVRFSALAAMAAICACAQAQVAYSSFLPGYDYDENTGYYITGADAPPKFIQTLAMGFESAASGQVDTVSVAVGFLNLGSGRDLRMTLFADDGTEQNFGTQLGSWDFVDTANDTTGEVFHIQNNDAVSLDAGSFYWLYMEPLQTDGFHIWMYGDQNILCPALISHDGGKTFSYSKVNTAPAMEMTVVPEPATVFALGAGLALLLRRRR
jgi:hypothetical protein